MIEGLKDKIQEYLYSIERKNFMKRWLTNIGTIQEEEDKIICHVSQKSLKRYIKSKGYTIWCYGMPPHEKVKQKVEYFKLDKPVYYIFDGIEFNLVRFCSLFNSIMIFKNCTFNNSLHFSSATKVILEKNTYKSWTKNTFRSGEFLSGSVHELIIQNEHLINSYEYSKKSRDFGVNITTDRLTIMSSTICNENEGQINIKAKETYISDSIIESDELYLDLDNIAYANSLLKATKGIIIENKNENCDVEMGFYHVDSPYVVYNGMEVINQEKEEQEPDKEKLLEERIHLVQFLTNLQNQCNKEMVMQYLREENDKPISRLLKKEEDYEKTTRNI